MIENDSSDSKLSQRSFLQTFVTVLLEVYFGSINLKQTVLYLISLQSKFRVKQEKTSNKRTFSLEVSAHGLLWPTTFHDRLVRIFSLSLKIIITMTMMMMMIMIIKLYQVMFSVRSRQKSLIECKVFRWDQRC